MVRPTIFELNLGVALSTGLNRRSEVELARLATGGRGPNVASGRRNTRADGES